MDKDKQLKTLDSTDKSDPTSYDKLCSEIVVTKGSSNGQIGERFLKLKNDKFLQEMGWTEDEIRQHLKATYLTVIRDLKAPLAFMVKEIAELKTKMERQRLINLSKGIDEGITDKELKVAHLMNEMVKTLDKVGFKEKKDMEVHHYFHDEVENGVLEGDWSYVHGTEVENGDKSGLDENGK